MMLGWRLKGPSLEVGFGASFSMTVGHLLTAQVDRGREGEEWRP